MAKILTQIEAHNIGNIRLFAGDAAELLAWAPAHSLARIDLIHPDPWPKRRHWKRRFVQDATVAAMARVLEAGRRISFRQRHRRLLRLDAGASVALARFRLDRGARRRLASAVARLHDDALRPQSRARRPPCGVFAISEGGCKSTSSFRAWSAGARRVARISQFAPMSGILRHAEVSRSTWAGQSSADHGDARPTPPRRKLSGHPGCRAAAAAIARYRSAASVARRGPPASIELASKRGLPISLAPPNSVSPAS